MRLIFYPQLVFAASAVAGSIAAVRTMDGSAILQKPDLDIKSKSSSSPVTVKRGFLTKFQTGSYRRNENRYERRSVPGCNNDYVRQLGGAFIPRSFMRRLVEVGAEECPSGDYEANLPSGMHVQTTRVNGTTDAHVDVNPKTKELITNDVGVVFLNTNKGAKFVIGEEKFDVEEGTLLMFPGGLVHHYIKMMKGGSGFVHLLGPFEVGGSHGAVKRIVWLESAYNTAKPGQKSAHANFNGQKRSRHLVEEGDGTNNSSSAVIGDIVITGYTNGTDLGGAVNRTLHLEWTLEGLYTDCGKESCFHVEIKDDPTFCDNVAIGQLQSDAHKRNSESDGESDGDDGNHIILKNISHTEVSQGESFLDIKKPIEHLLNFPVVVHGHDGAVLGCDILTEIIVQANGSDAATPVGGIAEVEGSSGAGASIISFGLVVAFVGAVASFVTI